MNSRGHKKNYNNNNNRRTSATFGTSPPLQVVHTQTQTQNSANQFQFLAPADQNELNNFKVALKDLTFNSRPIIENLTNLAKESSKTISGPISRTILDNLVFVITLKILIFLFLINFNFNFIY